MSNGLNRQHHKESPAERDSRVKREDLAKEKARVLEEDCRKLLAMPEFKRVMGHCMGMAGIFQSAMTGNSMTYYQIGKQDLGKEIWSFLAGADSEAAFALIKPQKFDGES